jgi:hypothetical protein
MKQNNILISENAFQKAEKIGKIKNREKKSPKVL